MAKGPLDHLSDVEKYLIALGLFTDKFALCETMLIIVLAKLTGLSDETSRAILSGVRSDTARTFIRRILEARGEEVPPYLARAFEQLGVISTIRNDLMHYGAQAVAENPSDMIVSNEIAAMPGRVRKTRISPEILTNLVTDLDTITGTLGYFHMSYHGIPSDLIPDWRRGAHRAWLYKPQLQAAPRQKRQRPRQRPKDPPRS